MPSGKLGFLGLLCRAGKLAVGPDAKSCRKAALYIAAADISPRSLREAEALSLNRGVPLTRLPHGKEEIGRALGMSEVALIAIKDRRAADSYMEKED